MDKKVFGILLIIVFFAPLFVFAKSYPNGILIRIKNDPKIYIINQNKKEWIKSLEEFKARKLSWKRVKTISLKEFDLIKEKENIPSPTSAITPRPSLSPSVSIIPSTVPSIPPTPTVTIPEVIKINPKLPPPDYIRADWLVSQATADYGRIGRKIIFKYSDKENDKVETFRLYEKKPGDKNFTKIAQFGDVFSTSCEAAIADKEWMITEAGMGQCSYWAMQKIVPPGIQGAAIAYSPAADYSEGGYVYYVVGVDKDGLETQPSAEAKLVFLTTINIFSPADGQPSPEIYPTFKWSVAGGWPSGATINYLILTSENKNALNPFWAKIIKVPAGQSEASSVYDGTGYNPASKYKVYIYGQYRQSEQDPDYISIPLTIPEFTVKSSAVSSWWGFLKGIIFNVLRFDLESVKKVEP